MPSAQTAKPAQLPVTLSDVKAHLRYDDTDQDRLILSLIDAAREKIEIETQRALITQEWTHTYDSWPCVFDRLRAPLQSVTSIEYIDIAGAPQTVPAIDYVVETEGLGRVSPAYSKSWPDYRKVPGGIRITYKAGYGDTSEDVPSDIKAALKLIVGHWFENRESVISGSNPVTVPMSVEYLLRPHKVMFC